MDEIDRLISTVRGKRLFEAVAAGVTEKMPCGEMRIAERLRTFGAFKLLNGKRRDVTTSWELTELGKRKLKV